MGWKPGHYLLLAVSLYALVVTFAFSLRGRQVAALRQEAMAYRERAAWAPEGYMLPLPGACLPSLPENLPGAPRPYRKGVSAGFVFRQGDACVPVVRGMGVVAAFGGEVVKVDPDFQELSEEAWQALLERVREGASPEEMDILRGLPGPRPPPGRPHHGLRPPPGPLPGAQGGKPRPSGGPHRLRGEHGA